MTFGYNGLGRLSGNETGSVGAGGGTGGQWGSTGWSRLFNSEIGGQISWLMPAAFLLLVAGLILTARASRADLHRALLIIMGGWLTVAAVTFSFMAGIFHAYCTVALAPAIAVLVGAGAVMPWQQRGTWLGRGFLAATIALSSVWAFVLLMRTTAFGSGLRIAVLAAGLSAAILVLVIERLHARAVPAVIALSLGAVLAGPVAYSATTLTQAHTGSIVTAGPQSGAGMGGPGGGAPGAGAPGTNQAGGTNQAAGAGQGGQSPAGGMPQGAPGQQMSSATVTALQKNASSYTWVAAAVGSQNAASLQLASGQPVMAIGGFNGSDPSPTLAQFKQYVAEGKIHYLLASNGMGGSNSGSAAQILSWVKANYSTVTIGGQTFYDLTSQS